MEEYFTRFEQRTNLSVNGSFVSSQDLDVLRNDGFLVEDFLDYLNQSNDLVFHGSCKSFSDYIKPSQRNGWSVHATEFGSITLLKAVLSNRGANLRYPINIQRGQDFPVVIEGLNERTVKRKGYVYMINNHNGSFKRGQGNIELIKPCKDKKDAVPFISKLEVLLSDFRVRHDIIKK